MAAGHLRRCRRDALGPYTLSSEIFRGQELAAGNSRGFWVFDPCKANGKDGDRCDPKQKCIAGQCAVTAPVVK